MERSGFSVAHRVNSNGRLTALQRTGMHPAQAAFLGELKLAPASLLPKKADAFTNSFADCKRILHEPENTPEPEPYLALRVVVAWMGLAGLKSSTP
jgi:hypothetical protein